jgi:choline dehydrogenase-like flavoprotein
VWCGVVVGAACIQVLLCGGAIQSPQLLMLSGIGPAEHLQTLGITPVADRPGVGHNLQDHPAVGQYRTLGL